MQLLSSTSDVARCDDILKTYLLACELKNTKLSILGLVDVEKLIAHDVVLPSALPSILATLKQVSSETFLLFTRSGLVVSLNDFIASTMWCIIGMRLRVTVLLMTGTR